MDERTAQEYLKLAQDAVLRDARPDINPTLAKALSHISAQVTELTFAELLSELTFSRGALESMLARSNRVVGVALIGLKKLLGLEENDTEDELNKMAHRGSDEDHIRQIMAALLEGTAAEVKRGEILAIWLSSPEKRETLWGKYSKVFVTKDFAPLKRMLTQKMQERDPQALKLMEKEAERIIEIADKQRCIMIFKNTSALLHLGSSMMQAFDHSKKRHAVLDYDDLISKVTNLLSRPDVGSWILYKLDGGLDHILVDEAQDTNPEQWQVIKTLAEEFFTGDVARKNKRLDQITSSQKNSAHGSSEPTEIPRTIFAVGDVKQSIYSFQRADPKEFVETREHFTLLAQQAGTAFENVSLGTSFRSTAAVLSLVDEVFNDDDSRHALSFSNEMILHRPHRTGEAGLVEIWPTVAQVDVEAKEDWAPPVIQKPAFSPEMRLATKIAQQIKNWIETKDILISKGRAVTPGDILILVRRRTKFDDYMISALKGLNIPVAGQDKMVLSEQLAVMDLMAMGEFALLPDDDLTLAVVLKSPFIGLSETQLYDLAQPRVKGRSLWAELLSRKDENPDFKAASIFLKELVNHADMLPPFEFFSNLLGRDRGREKILARLGVEAADPIDEFLQLAMSFEQNNISSLQGFLSWFNAGDMAIKRDMEQGSDQVRIMTIHGAKGLQAPIVFLPDTCQVPADRKKILWSSERGGSSERRGSSKGEGFSKEQSAEENGLMIWAGGKENETGPCEKARTKIKTTSEQEYKRLLYVALTRAEDRIYVTGWEQKTKMQEGSWYNLIRIAAAKMVGAEKFDVNEEEDRYSLRVTSPQLKEVDRDMSEGGRSVMFEPLRHMPLPSHMTSLPAPEAVPPKPLVPSRPEEEEPAVLSPLKSLSKKKDDTKRYHRGRLIHRLLEILPNMKKSLWQEAAEKYLSQKAHDLSRDNIIQIKSEVIRILEDEKLKDLFGRNSRAEVPIVGLIGHKAISGSVDRLAVTESHVLIIDYKTNRPPPLSVQDIPKIYLRQMAAYNEILKDIYPNHKVRCALLWTDIAQLMEIPVELLKDQI
jgi:ATP-dependent helicase/nuclease subunit A